MARQLRPRSTDQKLFPATIFFSLLLCKSFAFDTTNTGTLMSSCVSNYTETINNRTGLVDDKFQLNLQTLLTNLTSTSASTSTSSGFYNTTAGDSPYKSYGIYLCRGDITSRPQLCHSCVTNLTNWVTSYDANCTERVAYADYCMIRYANYSFFGTANDRPLGYSYDKFNISQLYNRTLAGVVEQVISDAAYNSTNLFATLEADVDEHESVYALAQCTPDIGRGGCSGCLKAARSSLERGVSGDVKFGWALLSSCQLRYDNASFFGVSSATLSPAPPLVSAFLVATTLLFINWFCFFD